MSDVHEQGTFNLPIGYCDNRIVLLARDPYWLFAYWELSQDKKDNFIREFGHDLWEKSVPVLKVTNVSKNTSFFVRVNDFSNNWYINVTDPDSLYMAELGRRISDHFFINLASSNYTVTPGNTVSSNTSAYFVNYKDLRNGILDIPSGKIYEKYDFKSQSQTMFGLSSPELFKMSMHQQSFGVSSAELFGINIAEHLGVSSQSFIR